MGIRIAGPEVPGGPDMNTGPALVLDRLSKRYGRVVGAEDVSLTVRSGEVFGFLGPNGAGKTTCIRMILGLIRPDYGIVTVLGRPVTGDAWRYRIGLGNLPSDVTWWPDLRGREILELFGRLRPTRPPRLASWLCERFRLDERLLSRKVRTYSRGEGRKLGLVAALQHDPDLVILDEPASGLDPILRRDFHDVLRTFKERGRTIFFSSHNLHETEQICDRVGIIREGRLETVETVESLRARAHRRVTLRFEDPERAAVFEIPGMDRILRMGTKVEFIFRGDAKTLLEPLAREAVEDVIITPPSLEELFLNHFKKRDQAEGGEA